METTRKVHNRNNRLLPASKRREQPVDRTNTNAILHDLHAVAFKRLSGKQILDKLKLPYVTPKEEYYRSILVHICLSFHADYKPKLFKKADETVNYILTEANRIMPDYEIVTDEGHDWEQMISDMNLNAIIAGNYFHMRRPADQLYYCDMAEDTIMEWKGIEKWKGTPEYDILSEAIQLLIHLGINDVKDNNSYDLSDETLYETDDDQYEQLVNVIERDIEESFKDQYACPGATIDEKKFKKELEKKVKAMIKAEKDLRKKVVKPMYKRRPLNHNLLEQASRRPDDLGKWITHLLKLWNDAFQFGHYILLMEREEYYPVQPDQCIGLAYDINQYCYKLHFQEVESTLSQYGSMPIGEYEYISPKNGTHYKAEGRPVMSWLRLALNFDISNLTYVA